MDGSIAVARQRRGDDVVVDQRPLQRHDQLIA
jgi:hypothetical protein